jgi:hypothetical protein
VNRLGFFQVVGARVARLIAIQMIDVISTPPENVPFYICIPVLNQGDDTTS